MFVEILGYLFLYTVKVLQPNVYFGINISDAQTGSAFMHSANIRVFVIVHRLVSASQPQHAVLSI